MFVAVWSAAACAVAGATVGALLPSIGHRVAHGQHQWMPFHSDRVRVMVVSGITALVMGVFGYLDHGPALVAWCWLTITGMCLALVDIDCQRLPRSLVGAMAIGGLVVFVPMALLGAQTGALLRALVALMVTFVIMFLVAVIAPGHLGGGDVTLYPVLALYLGWAGWSTLALGVLIGLVLATGYATSLLLAGRARWRTRIPAGPPLILGAIAAIGYSTHAGAV